MAQARLSLLSAEVATGGQPEAQLAALSAEVAAVSYADLQFSRLAAEVATGNRPDPQASALSVEVSARPVTPVHVSGLAVEVATGNLPDPRIALLSVEVATSASTLPTLTLTGCTPPVGWVTGGDAVVLTGTGFLSGAVVTFGGTQATSVVVVNPTTITCLTPAQSGMVTVTVTLLDGRSDSLVNGFTYFRVPPYQCQDRFPAQEPLP